MFGSPPLPPPSPSPLSFQYKGNKFAVPEAITNHNFGGMQNSIFTFRKEKSKQEPPGCPKNPKNHKNYGLSQSDK